MAFYDKFPYTNFQEINLDVIMAKVKELDQKYGTGLPTYIKQFLVSHINEILAGVLYSADEEMITLSTPVQAVDAEHYYDVTDQEIVVTDDTEV